MSVKKIVAIHDISCFGRCSLTVALPLLSALGIQTSVIPTAVLSTHTGGFVNNTFCDLSGQIEPIAEHWKKCDISFDGIYSGYLSSEKQVFSVINTINLLKTDSTLVIVDPVMGDNGRLYSGFSKVFPSYMLKLCKKADIITPNITEACLLTNCPYKENYDRDFIKKLAFKLFEFSGAKVIITGVSFDEKRIGAVVYDGNELYFELTEKQSSSFHSTGDIFASVLSGALLNERGLKSAVQIAANFTSNCIRQTVADNTDPRYGVNFESQIPHLVKLFDN